MKLRFHPSVQAELGHLAAWYEERREGLGADLRDEVSRALGAIIERPARWPISQLPKARSLGVRHFAMARFPLAIEYTADEMSVTVLAVAHMSRRPGYWLSRVAGATPKRKVPRRTTR